MALDGSAQHAWLEHLTKQRRSGLESGGESVAERLAAAPAHLDVLQGLELACDQDLMRDAAARVRLRIEPRTVTALELTAREGRTGAEASAHLGMQVATVFVARSRALRMRREEAARLERPG